jgi:hypothetical protein
VQVAVLDLKAMLVILVVEEVLVPQVLLVLLVLQVQPGQVV